MISYRSLLLSTIVLNDIYIYIYIHTHNIYQVGGCELQPRKLELMSTHSKRHGYRGSLHKTTKPVITPTETSLTTLIFLI